MVGKQTSENFWILRESNWHITYKIILYINKLNKIRPIGLLSLSSVLKNSLLMQRGSSPLLHYFIYVIILRRGCLGGGEAWADRVGLVGVWLCLYFMQLLYAASTTTRRKHSFQPSKQLNSTMMYLWFWFAFFFY